MNTQVSATLVRSHRLFALVAIVASLVCAADSSPAQTFVKMDELLFGADDIDCAAQWADYNDDGFIDLLACGRLYRNNGGANFTLVVSNLGESAWGDIDNDGLLDLFRWRSVGDDARLWHNQGGDTFVELPIANGTQVNSRGATWGDWDGDGDLDIYVGGYEEDNGCGCNPGPDALYVNNGNNTFTVSDRSGNLPTRGISPCDFDVDGDLDIYVSHYRLLNNILWRNTGAGGAFPFADAAVLLGAQGGSGHTIGSAWGDLDNDGNIDLFVGNFAHPGQPETRFLRNTGSSGGYGFQDMGSTVLLPYVESYASPTLGDFDNDGDLDFYLSNAAGYGDHAVLYRNYNGWRFSPVTYLDGLGEAADTHQAAFADFDNDGDLDLVTAGNFYVNQGNDLHWLKVKLQGNGTTVSRLPIGAQVRITLPGGWVVARQVEGATGEGNHNGFVMHFGLGDHASPVDLDVLWPDGSTETVPDVAVDQMVTVGE